LPRDYRYEYYIQAKWKLYCILQFGPMLYAVQR
jgi:hypothetical protein